MKFCHLLPLVLSCWIGESVSAESESEPKLESKQRAITVLREWSEINQTFTSVRGEFHRIRYDDVFQVEIHAEGEFGYLQPRYGFWRSGHPAQKPGVASLKKTAEGKSYEYKASEAEHCRWQKTRLLIIDEDEKTYEEWTFANLTKQRATGNFWAAFFNFPADGLSPFLPGVANQERVNDWLKQCDFKVIKESKTHIWIAGKLMQREHDQHFSEFKLYLEKRPWRLKAVQYIHPGGNQSTVYTYSNIEMNPLEWDEPDLTGYQNPTEQPLVARRPEPEE